MCWERPPTCFFVGIPRQVNWTSWVEGCIRAFGEQKRCEMVELNVQCDHVHLISMIPPKIGVSDMVGIWKGRTAIRVFNWFDHLKQKPYWGNHFWTR